MKILTISILLCLLTSNISLCQKTRHIYYFYDLDSKEPIPNVNVSARFLDSFGTSDLYGICKFKLGFQVDSIKIWHTNYKGGKAKLASVDTIYLVKQIHNIGGFKFKNPDLPENLECVNLTDLTKIDCADYKNFHPNFFGGWICFDNYIYNQIVKRKIYESIVAKKIEIIFKINLQGNIDYVEIKRPIGDKNKEQIKEIFINSPLWIPTCDNDIFYESLCKYTIIF